MPALPDALLTLSPPGEPTFARVTRKLELFAVRALLTARPRLPGAQSAAFRRLQEILTASLRDDPEALRAAVASPDVLPSVLCLAAGAWPEADCVATAVPHLLAALGRLPESLVWPAGGTLVAGDRVLQVDALLADPAGVSVERAGRRTELAESLGPPASLPLRAGRLALWDSNPLCGVEAHPDKNGNVWDLGGRAAADWQAALDEALGWIEAHLPGFWADAPWLLRRVVPVGWEPERHLSASYREAPGRVYLTLHPSTLTLAEALVHEAQHGKLNAVTWLDPLLHNGRTDWTPSPVRPDLRPLIGVLLAVHAFVPVAALHRSLLDAGHPATATPAFEARRAQVLDGNERGLQILEARARPTPLGASVLRGLRALHDALGGGARQPPRDALPPG